MMIKIEEARAKVKARLAELVDISFDQWVKAYEEALAEALKTKEDADPLKFRFPVGLTVNLFQDPDHALLTNAKATWGVRHSVTSDV